MRVSATWAITDKPPVQPDCFIVPSYTMKNRYKPAAPTRAQINLAVDWWRRFPMAKIIMATGDAQGLGVPDSAIMAAYGLTLGLPPQAIIEEDRSENTFENLLFSAEILLRHHFRQPTLVTYDLHTRRVVAMARRLGWRDFYWLSATSTADGAAGVKWLRTFSRPGMLAYELLATVYSKRKGWM